MLQNCKHEDSILIKRSLHKCCPAHWNLLHCIPVPQTLGNGFDAQWDSLHTSQKLSMLQCTGHVSCMNDARASWTSGRCSGGTSTTGATIRDAMKCVEMQHHWNSEILASEKRMATICTAGEQCHSTTAGAKKRSLNILS